MFYISGCLEMVMVYTTRKDKKAKALVSSLCAKMPGGLLAAKSTQMSHSLWTVIRLACSQDS